MEFNIDPKDLNLQDAAGMQLVEVIRNLADESGTADYEDLENLPKINGVTLVGDKSSDDLHIAVSDEQVAEAVDAWLADNVDPDTGYVLDSTLSMNNAAAPSDKVGKLKDDIDKVVSFITPTNLYNGEVWDVDGFISASGFNSYADYFTSDPIYLESGNYLYNIRQGSYGANYTAVWETDNSGDKIEAITATDTNETYTTPTYTYNIMKVSIDSDGWYRFNVGYTTAQQTEFMLVEGEDASDFPTSYQPYFDEYAELTNNVANAETNPLVGKKIALTGDSICYGAGYSGGYGKIIADKYKMSYQNIAQAGGAICSNVEFSDHTLRFCICESIDDLVSDADYIILEGGVNDSVSDKIGQISEGYTAELDTDYFYPACEAMFKAVSERFKGKKYGFIIPHQMTSTMNPNGSRYNAIKECAAKWGVPVLDLAIQIPPFGMLPADNALRTAYTDNGDGWHPNEDGYKKYYCDKIEAWMKTL